jgi:hypothetical protein
MGFANPRYDLAFLTTDLNDVVLALEHFDQLTRDMRRHITGPGIWVTLALQWTSMGLYHQHRGISVPLVETKLLLPVVEFKIRPFAIIWHVIELYPVLDQTLLLMNVSGGKIGLVLKDDAVLFMDVVLVKVGGVADPIDAVNIRQVKKDFRPRTDYDQLPMRMV